MVGCVPCSWLWPLLGETFFFWNVEEQNFPPCRWNTSSMGGKWRMRLLWVNLILENTESFINDLGRWKLGSLCVMDRTRAGQQESQAWEADKIWCSPFHNHIFTFHSHFFHFRFFTFTFPLSLSHFYFSCSAWKNIIDNMQWPSLQRLATWQISSFTPISSPTPKCPRSRCVKSTLKETWLFYQIIYQLSLFSPSLLINHTSWKR